MLNFFAIVLIIFIGILLLVFKKRSFKKLINQSNLNSIKLKKNKKSNNKFLSKKNILRLKIFTSLVSLLFFLILFYFGFLMVEEAFTKNYSTGTVWDPPLWVPYSSMMIGAALMILQYIAEIIKLTDEQDTN